MAEPIVGGGGGSGGGGYEDDPRTPQVALRSQGLLSLAFGFALGITFVVLLWLLKLSLPDGDDIKSLVEPLQWWQVFLFGSISGTLIASIYNLLVVRKLNLFSLDNNTD